MKKDERIKNKIEFDDFIKNTKYHKNAFYILHYRNKTKELGRFGIAVGTKIGNAVTRNKLKRRIREIIKEEQSIFKKDKDYIIILRKACLELTYKQMKEKLIELA